MSKNKDIFKPTGITPENKIVLAGCFDMYQIHGVPLDMIFSYLKEHDCVPDWIDIYRSARSNGMSHERILAKLEPDIDDSFGPEWTKEVLEKLNLIFGEKK
jgi:hypothetical protein